MATPWYEAPVWQPFLWTPNNPTAHSGVDLGMPMGTVLTALLPGVILSAGIQPWGGQVNIQSLYPSVGPIVVSYLHLSRITVKAGQVVNPGDVIGYSGEPPSPQYGSGAHTHFEVNRGTTAPYMGHSGPVNPIDPTFLLSAAQSGQLGTVTAGGLGGVLALFSGGIGGTIQGAVKHAPGFAPVVETIHKTETFPGFQITSPVGSTIHNAEAFIVRGIIVLVGLILVLGVLLNLMKDSAASIGVTPGMVAGLAAMA